MEGTRHRAGLDDFIDAWGGGGGKIAKRQSLIDDWKK